MDQVLRGSRSTISVTLYDGETPLDSSTPVTIQVLRGDGSTIVPAGTATSVGTVGDGKYDFTLTPDLIPTVDLLEARWTATLGGSAQTFSTWVEVVGGFYVSLQQIRSRPNLNDMTRFPTDKLIEARQWFEAKFEDATGVAWVPRYARETASGTSANTLLLHHFPVRAVLSVRAYSDATTYTSFTSNDLADLGGFPSGLLTRNSGLAWNYGTNNYVIEYEHGHSQVPSDVADAALVAIRDRLLDENVGNRQFSVQSEAGIVRSALPGPNSPFGIPFVDEVAVRRNERVTVG